jgi:putative tryptophan/tyrosine transport system substrate-binding protein
VPDTVLGAGEAMRRREFITLVAGATAWPLAVRAQQAAMPVIGFLNSSSPETFTPFLASFRQGLSETGFVEGQNVAIEYRWAEGAYEQLPVLAADLVRRQVAVIIAGAPPAAVAAKAATTTIPIVFTSGGDPVALGLVSSLSRPGANVTGVSFLLNELGAKRLELLHELVPTATSIGYLFNKERPSSESEAKYVQQAAQTFGMQLHVFNASTERELDAALTKIGEQKVHALVVGNDAFFLIRRDQIAAQAARLAVPTMFGLREYVRAGGLMSYAPSLADVYRQAGVYTGRILKGETPADLPVTQPTKFEMTINLKTARALGLNVPPQLQQLADEVIE